MNYAEKKSAIRRKIVLCTLLFICSITITGIMLGFFVSSFVFGRFFAEHDPSFDRFLLTCYVVIPLTIIVIFIVALWKIKTLREEGGIGIALKLGAMPITGNSNDYYLLRLKNIVEELSIAAAEIPVPTIFYLDKEDNINAFAIGYTLSDAAIVVTKGALKRLNRAELEGVIGHELAHILHGDMRLNTFFFGFIYVISLVYNDGKKLVQSDWRDKIIGIPELIIGSFGMLCGKLITSYLSREEEYFADATAVQLTRQTAGIIGALKKIGSLTGSSTMSNSSLMSFNHMLFNESTYYSKLMSTHPTIIKRIQALEPNFNPIELKELEERWLTSLPDGQKEDELMRSQA